MSRTSAPCDIPSAPLGGLLRCLDCVSQIGAGGICLGCGKAYPEREGIVDAIGPLIGRNRITEAFYSGSSWERFRPWERRFIALQGGNRRARRPILRHLSCSGILRVLEVGIGDGDNLEFLPDAWEVVGVDHSRSRLEACVRRCPEMTRLLVRAQAEALPFPDHSFDATLCVGGFTMFGDHRTALREMRRVTRPKGALVVADEQPWLSRMGIGHLVGVPGIDRWWLGLLGLDREFIEMVFELPRDLGTVFDEELPGAERHYIWGGLGYCIVHR